MLAHPDELSKFGEILHRRGIECVSMTTQTEAHCYHSLSTITKHEKPSSQGYIHEPDDSCDT